MTDERERIRFVVERDGNDAARQWVERTLKIYRSAIDSADSHASTAQYRSLFEDAIRTFEQWLSGQGHGDDADR